MLLQVVTPRKVVKEVEVKSVTLPTIDGEITILPHHIPLLSLLAEGIVVYRTEAEEDDIAIGGGYVQTDGTNLRILVSRAYGQDEIDEQLTAAALEQAQELLKNAPDVKSQAEAQSIIRRSLLDTKLLKRRKNRV